MKMITILIFILFSLKAFAPSEKVMYILRSQSEISRPYEKIWEAVIAVESGGDPFAVGDKHMEEYSYGIAQIRQIRIDHYNDLTGCNLRLVDVYDPEISKEVFMYFATGFRPDDYEGISKAWNGSTTDRYWNKVKKHLVVQN